MSFGLRGRDRLRRKQTLELDELYTAALNGQSVRSSSYSPPRGRAAISDASKIARDFSVVTLENAPPRNATPEARGSEGTDEAADGSQKLSTELFSWRNPLFDVAMRTPANSSGSAPSQDDLFSVSSDQLSEASFGSVSERSTAIGGRTPASHRGKAVPQTSDDKRHEAVRNEFIVVGIGLISLFFFFYIVQYFARHGYIQIPEHDMPAPPAAPHDEL